MNTFLGEYVKDKTWVVRRMPDKNEHAKLYHRYHYFKHFLPTTINGDVPDAILKQFCGDDADKLDEEEIDSDDEDAVEHHRQAIDLDPDHSLDAPLFSGACQLSDGACIVTEYQIPANIPVISS